MINIRLILNIVLFQIGWFACILLSPHWAYISCVSILSAHFIWVVPKGRRMTEAGALIKVLVVGAVLEVLYFRWAVLIREDGILFPPIWLLLIWLMFATTFSHSLVWLRSKLYLAVIFAAIAAPMSYYAGAQLNTQVSFNASSTMSVMVISITWALVFPLLIYCLVPMPNDYNKLKKR